MSYYIPYTSLASIGTFAPTTVHSAEAHNTPHNRLLANDVALSGAVNTLESTVSALAGTLAGAVNTLESTVGAIEPGYIETVYVGQASGPGTYPNFAPSKSFNYRYSGLYVPVSLFVAVFLNGFGAALCRNQVRWADTHGQAMTPWTDFVALNPLGAGDGGAGLNDTFCANVPFIVSSRFIEFQDLHYTTRASWLVLTLTYQRLSRPPMWGY